MSNSLSDPIIQIVVRNATGMREILNIHQGVLTKSSDFFKRSIKPEWTSMKECPDEVKFLDDNDDIECIKDYLKWLYEGVVQVGHTEIPDKSARDGGKVLSPTYAKLAKDFVFGEMVLDTKYKNNILAGIDKVTAKSWITMTPRSIAIIYDGTPDGSLIRSAQHKALLHLHF